jgi:hypothetical protein
MDSHNIQQQGGNYLLDDHITSNIEAILSGNYKLLSDTTNVDTMKINLDECMNADGMFDPAKSSNIMYKPGNVLKCFINDPTITEFTLENEAEYLFRKQFSLDVTDMFMQKNMSVEDLEKTTNYIYYVFDYTLTKLVETLIKNNVFGPKTKHLIGNVYLFYKGGNTTRLLLRNFVRAALKRIEKNKSLIRPDKVDIVDTSVTKLNEIVGSFNIGDWDYMMKIKFDELTKFNYSQADLEKLVMYLMQVFYSTSTYIKGVLSNLLKSKNNIDILSTAIQDYILNTDTQNKIDSFIIKYNNHNKTVNKIDTLKLKKINMYDVSITENEKRRMTQNEMNDLYKSSYLFASSGKLVKYKNKNITYKEYYAIDTPYLDDSTNSQIPEYLTNDTVYLAYLSKLCLFRRYVISDFNLIRVKVNNEIHFDIKYSNMTNNVEKTMSANADLVDFSVPNIYDFNSINEDLYSYKPQLGLSSVRIQNEDFKNEKIDVLIPSAQTMFADICTMLFLDNMFIWENPKYAKRIRRLFFLVLPCMYNDDSKTNIILKNFKMLRRIFTDINKFNTKTVELNINDKLRYFSRHYEIIDSPYNEYYNQKLTHYTTPKFQQLNITHKILRIKPGSIFKLQYLEFLIANYIKTLIIAKYIIYNNVDPDHEDLILYELQIHRIAELTNVTEYVKPDVSPITPSLNHIYKNIRGTSHSYKGTTVLKKGRMPALLPAVDDNVNVFFDPRATNPSSDSGLIPFEETIINNSLYIEDILKGLREAHISALKYIYTSNSLF